MPGRHSPHDSYVRGDVAVRPQRRTAPQWSSAVATGTPNTPGRRLPTHQELRGAVSYQQIALTPGGELTANVYPGANPPDPLNVLVMTTETGAVAVTTDTFAGRKPYRCVVDPLN